MTTILKAEVKALPRRVHPYVAYKNSGIEWLGEIPQHWESRKLKRVARLLYGDALAAESRVDGDVKVFGSNGPVSMHDRANTLAPCLIVGRKGSFGKIHYSSDPVFAIDTTFLADERTTNADLRWLYYVLLNARLDQVTKDSAIPGLDREDAYICDVCKCPAGEQRAIAAFLDRETARIDALVAKKERLIELLHEKRAALISQAVTKGFNPPTSMRATGLTRFPEIPERWQMRKLRRLVGRVKRPVHMKLDAEYREIGIRSWGKGIFHKDSVRGAQLEEKNVFAIENGDLILNIVFAWEGAVAVASESEEGMVGSHRFPTFRPASDQVQLDYLLMFLQSEQGRGLMSVNSPGAAGRNRTIRLDQFLDEEIPLPPLGEQREIVKRFRREENLLAAADSQLRRLANILTELRTALILAAVTGKIDVRGAL